MTHRERMLVALQGGIPDRIPFAPRLDLWQIALQARGTLPAPFRNLDTPGLADAFGVACHAVRADYTRPRPLDDLQLRALGADNHADYPYRTQIRGLACRCQKQDDDLHTSIDTPAGAVRCSLRSTPEMRRAGISLPYVLRYPLAAIEDLQAVACVFDHLEVVPTPQAYAAFRQRVGERGLAVASGPFAASPMHLILHDLAPMDAFFYLYSDHRAELERLAVRMTPYFEAALDALLQCEAEVIFWGSNYDRDLTWPPFFEQQIAPWLRHVSERAHAAGKYVLTHTDGENDGLLPLYRTCGFDVAESVCPAPMTRLSLAQVRQGMGPSTTVWGGVPSVALLPDSMGDAVFEAYVAEMFARNADGARLILGVSDNVPPDADLDRLLYIERQAAQRHPRPAAT